MDEYIELRKDVTVKGRFSLDGKFWFDSYNYPNGFYRWMQKIFLGIVWEKL